MPREDDSQDWWPPRQRGSQSPPTVQRKARPTAKRKRKPSLDLPLAPPRAKQIERPTGHVPNLKNRIKKAIIENRNITLEELEQHIRDLGAKVSRVTVSNIRSETRHTLALLDQEGWLRSTPRSR